MASPMPADRTLELRMSGRLADLLSEISTALGEKPHTLAREALEKGLLAIKADRCPPKG